VPGTSEVPGTWIKLLEPGIGPETGMLNRCQLLTPVRRCDYCSTRGR